MSESASADPPSSTRLVVRRSGGLAGVTLTGSIELAVGGDGGAEADERAATARELLDRIDLPELADRSVAGAPTTGSRAPGRPDGFIYHIDHGTVRVSLGERNLTDDLRRLVTLVLDRERY